MAHPGVPSSMRTVPSGYHKENEPLEARLLRPVSIKFWQRPACEVNTSHTDAPCWIKESPSSFWKPKFNLCELVLDLGGGELSYHPDCWAANMYYSLKLSNNYTTRDLEDLKVGYNRISKTRWLRLEGVLPLDIVYEIHHTIDILETEAFNKMCTDVKRGLKMLIAYFKLNEVESDIELPLTIRAIFLPF